MERFMVLHSILVQLVIKKYKLMRNYMLELPII